MNKHGYQCDLHADELKAGGWEEFWCIICELEQDERNVENAKALPHERTSS